MSFGSDFERAMDCIEEGLTGEIDLGAAAKRMKCSAYHLQRLFSFLADIPLSE